jgi:hypothetical protein
LKNRTAITFAAVVATLAVIAIVFIWWRPDAKPSIRKLEAQELIKLTETALEGDCDAAYQVALHHEYFSLEDGKTIQFLRLAAKCDNPGAYEGLIATLAGRREFAAEVDAALIQLRRLDPKRADAAETEIAHRRQIQ